MSFSFEWAKLKSSTNIKKHNVSFDEASSVFYDPLATIFDDEYHSDDEPREIIIGYSATERLLIVSFTERHPDRIRLISARLATSKERKDHEEYRNARFR